MVGFTAAYLLPATPYAWFSGNAEFVFYIIVMLLLAALVAVVHARVALPTAMLWCFSGWGLLHMAGGLAPVPPTWPIAGETPVLYSLWLVPGSLKYDHLVHAYGFGVTAWLCWRCLEAITGQRRATSGMMILSAAAAMGFGALNEVVEFIATLTVPETNVGGYVNTGWDLVANAAGAIVAVGAIRLRAAVSPPEAERRRAEP